MAAVRPVRTVAAMSLVTTIARALRRFAPPFPPAAPPDELRSCPACGDVHVCPVDWEPRDDDHWWILARCGDCGLWSETIITNARAARLDRELDRDIAAIRSAARRLDLERMTTEVEAFATALDLDLIAPADFSR